MAACVGIQNVSEDQFIPNGFLHRPLPHFTKFDCSLPTVGFVENSFFRGLNPTEFFFHAISSNDAMNAATLRTQENGRFMRRLMKTMEDLRVAYDNTVRNARGEVVQFVYGEDGRDAAHTQFTQIPIKTITEHDFTSKFCHWWEPYPEVQVDYGDPVVRLVLQEEEEEVRKDIKEIREAEKDFSHVSSYFSASTVLPIHLERIISSAQKRFRINSTRTRSNLHPAVVAQRVKDLCGRLGLVSPSAPSPPPSPSPSPSNSPNYGPSPTNLPTFIPFSPAPLSTSPSLYGPSPSYTSSAYRPSTYSPSTSSPPFSTSAFLAPSYSPSTSAPPFSASATFAPSYRPSTYRPASTYNPSASLPSFSPSPLTTSPLSFPTSSLTTPATPAPEIPYRPTPSPSAPFSHTNSPPPPTSPSWSPTSPHYSPTSPSYSPTSPPYSPTSPPYSPTPSFKSSHLSSLKLNDTPSITPNIPFPSTSPYLAQALREPERDTSLTLMRIALRCALASKRVLHEYRLTPAAFEWVLHEIETRFMRSAIQPGMCPSHSALFSLLFASPPPFFFLTKEKLHSALSHSFLFFASFLAP